MTPPGKLAEGFKYDVAISFLWQDLAKATALKQLLEPSLSVYVASEEKEATLGTDALESFRRVFRYESRMAVILHRKAWGETPMTAAEEIGIKDRATLTHMKSFVVVRMDDAPLRVWIPDCICGR